MDADMPDVALEAFNPLIPADVDASSLPVAILRYRVRNTSRLPMEVTIAGTIENFVGSNGTDDAIGGNINRFEQTAALAGVLMTAPELDARHEAGGEFCLATIRGEGSISHRTGWADAMWSNSVLEFWDDFLDDGLLDNHDTAWPRPVASLTNAVSLLPGEEGTITFLLTWNFPNRRAWRSDDYGDISVGAYTHHTVGNHYSTVHPHPWQTAQYVAAELSSLEERSRRASAAVINTNAPQAVREAALFNLSTLRSPTLFRTADGNFYGWEGVKDREGSCFGTCTHVWGYEFATSFWFREIATSFRETQYLRSTDDRGRMAFRATLPISATPQWSLAAADGQMATLVHLFVDYVLAGDVDYLRRLWPAARRTLEFAWIPGGWDADQDGVMEGCQHNTMDVEYYGPNPQMQSWYLAALRAAEEMATDVGDTEFASKCRDLYEQGSGWTDDNLFNGRYYEHQILPIHDPSTIAADLRQPVDGRRPDQPILQLGKGVLIDQLVGQYAARLAGLGGVLDSQHVRTALSEVYRRNHRPSMWGHFNHMRGYALDDESAVVMADYAPGERPDEPFPYFNEVMTGFEYTLAVNHIQDGSKETATAIIESIRARYDGRRRNPFDETECGRHYARAMSSWSALIAWNDVSWDGRTGVLATALQGGSSFFSTGLAAGEIRRDGGSVEVDVLEGILPIRALSIGDRSLSIADAAVRPRGWRWNLPA